jgi:hypothetical protein
MLFPDERSRLYLLLTICSIYNVTVFQVMSILLGKIMRLWIEVIAVIIIFVVQF